MSELINRLQIAAGLKDQDPTDVDIQMASRDAIAEIERLLGALEPFAKAAMGVENVWQSHYGCAEVPNDVVVAVNLRLADLRHARSVMMHQP